MSEEEKKKLPDLTDFNIEIAEQSDTPIGMVARVMGYVYRQYLDTEWRSNLLSAVLRSQVEHGDDKTAEYDQK